MQLSDWPRPRDYQDAIQTPRVCFSDPRLKAAKIHETALGLPLVATGRSAIVFKATAGHKDAALRCFTRAASGQRLRYQAIHAYIAAARPDYMVDFTYRDHEVLVGGNRYPLVEMTWVTGDPLDVWIKGRLGQGDVLGQLAERWLAMVNDMQVREMAHGDLANDNCIIGGSRLKLIDYDGFFVPDLASDNPNEAGVAHFQHPERPGYYSGNMDAFPAVMVYLSLVALQSDPSLWRFHKDKNLIFLAPDYQAPGRTAIWAALAGHHDPRVRALAVVFGGMCQTPIARLPSLREAIARAGIPSAADPRLLLRWKPDPLAGRPQAGSTPRFRPPAPTGPTVPAPSVPTLPWQSGSGAPGWLKDQMAGQDQTPPPIPPIPTRPPARRPVSPPARPAVRPPARPAGRTTRRTPGPARPVTPARRPAPPPARRGGPAATTTVVITALVVLILIILIVALA
jgi:hypothetical protein